MNAGLRRRQRTERIFRLSCAGVTWLSVLFLAVLLGDLLWEGLTRLSFDFIRNFPSRFPDQAGIRSALFGSVWLLGLVTVIAIPLGIATAIYLEEYQIRGRFGRLIEINIANLAGVPSIVYGLLGLAVFVRFFSFGRSLLSGSLTLSLLVLPVIILASREALRAVPRSLRLGAYALGATRWQTIFHHVLPAASPGILTGVILALSRAMGETAPLIMVGALTYVAFVPAGPMDSFTALPIQIFNWAARPQHEFQIAAAAGILVLLAVLLLMNATAVYIRYRTRRSQNGN